MDDIYIKNIVRGVLQTSKWMALLTEDYVPLMVEFHRFFFTTGYMGVMEKRKWQIGANFTVRQTCGHWGMRVRFRSRVS